MSSSARDQCWDMLPTRRISPLGTCQTVPFTARSRVVRSDTASTVPVASPTSTMSPTPNWSSIRMKMPLRKSFTSDCEPKPSATPMIPAPASNGPSSIPTSPRTRNIAMTPITHDATDRSTVASAWIRCSARIDISSVSSSADGARSRTELNRSCSPPVCSRCSVFLIDRRTIRLITNAPIRIAMIVNPLPSTKSAIFATIPESVQSNVSRQNTPGSSPHASRNRRGTGSGRAVEAWASGISNEVNEIGISVCDTASRDRLRASA